MIHRDPIESNGKGINNVMMSYHKDQLRKLLRNGVNPEDDNDTRVRDALSAANNVLRITTPSAIDDAISKCQIAANGNVSGVTTTDLNRIKGALEKIKSLYTSIKHSDGSAPEMLANLFMLEHGDDAIGEYVG